MESTQPSTAGVAAPSTLRGRYKPPPPAEQARRVAWGKQAGAQVAAAYKQLQEEQPQ